MRAAYSAVTLSTSAGAFTRALVRFVSRHGKDRTVTGDNRDKVRMLIANSAFEFLNYHGFKWQTFC